MSKIESKEPAAPESMSSMDAALIDLKCAVANLGAIWELLSSDSGQEDYLGALYSAYRTIDRHTRLLCGQFVDLTRQLRDAPAREGARA